MDKRYQIFVSSTYADLKDERSKVIQTLMEMDCIPAGMELFPAVDEEQFEFIKKVIDDCDYYVLIVGGRYGSLTSEGISYTEKEYDYAYSSGKNVLAFLHSNPDDIPVNKSDIDPVLREKLRVFRDKVAKSRLIKYWNNAQELPGLLALSLSKTIKMFPEVGWVRGDKASNEKLLEEINELRKENENLKMKLANYVNKTKPKLDNLATLNEQITVKGKRYDPSAKYYRSWELKLSWSEIFGIISPYLLEFPHNDIVKSNMGKYFYEKATGTQIYGAELNDQDFQTIKIQFTALNLIEIQLAKTNKGGMGLFWNLTPKGRQLMLELRTVKSN
jgi:hypothetical protein